MLNKKINFILGVIIVIVLIFSISPMLLAANFRIIDDQEFGLIEIKGENILDDLSDKPDLGWTGVGSNALSIAELSHGDKKVLEIIADETPMIRVSNSIDLEAGKGYYYSSWHKVSDEIPSHVSRIPHSVIFSLEDGEGNEIFRYSQEINRSFVGNFKQIKGVFGVPEDIGAAKLNIDINYFTGDYSAYLAGLELFEVKEDEGFAYLFSDDILVTLESEYRPLNLRYIGDNGKPSHRYSNHSKYWSDSMFSINRLFGNMGYTPSSPKDSQISSQASFEKAKQEVINNPYDNSYLTLQMIDNDLRNDLALNQNFISLSEYIAESRRLGIDSIRVVGPWWAIPPGNYRALWNTWKQGFAYGYLLAENYDLFNYNSMNEPDDFIESDQWDSFVAMLTAMSDGVKAGAEVAGIEAEMWAPTFARNDQTALEYITENAHQAIDVFNFHSYSSNPGTYTSRVNEHKNRIARHTDQEKEVAITEFNYSLAGGVAFEDHDKMDNVFKNMDIYKGHLDSGLYASVRFMFPRMNRTQAPANQPESGNFSLGLVRVDDATREMTEGTKMYYGTRMLTRAVRYPRLAVSYSTLGDSQKQDFIVTKGDNHYFVLFINKEEDFSNLELDLSKLGINNSILTRREVSDQLDDEFIGNYEIIDGMVRIEDIPGSSMTLLVIPEDNDIDIIQPEVHRAFAETDGIELWWHNSPEVGSYNVKRKLEGGEYNTIASAINHSFYTDTTAEIGKNYYYKVTAVSGNREGEASKEVGPLQLIADPLLLPYRYSFVDMQDTGWEQNSGEWNVVQSYEDPGYLTKASTGERNIAIIGGDKSKWQDYALDSRVYLEELTNESKFGLVARYIDENNYYLFVLDNDSNRAMIKKIADGEEEVLASTTLQGKMPIEISDYRYMLRVNVDRGSLNFSGNQRGGNNFNLSASDMDPLAGGKVGFYAENDVEVFFDGLMVRPVFSDSYLRRNDWQEVNNTWNIKYNGNSRWQDVYLTAKMRFDEFLSEDGKSALFLRYNDEDNHYRVELSAENDLALVKRVAGVEEIISSKSYNVEEGQLYTMVVILERNLLRVFINGMLEKELMIWEPELESGKIAIGTHNAKVKFSDIALQ
ncbi:family 16 glycoside hydrolase [Natronospora cellulosivora (SeqCode)]